MNRPLFSSPRIERDLLILPTSEYYRRRYRKSRVGSWLLFTVTTLAVLLAAVGARAEDASQALAYEQVALEDAGSGDLLFVGREAGAFEPALHLSTAVDMRVRGLVAEVQIAQTFTNTSNHWREAVYVLPLPENAAVRGMEIVIGERRIVGKVREREEAKKVYAEARAAGKRAALLEQQRPNMFTSRVANIAPGEKIAVEVRYLQTLKFDRDQFSLRLPSTLTPRYIPGVPGEHSQESAQEIALNPHGWSLPTDQVPDAQHITPFMVPMAELANRGSHQMSIHIDLGMGLPLADIYSPYHEVDFRRQDGNRYQVQLKGGSAPMDRDFVLHWRPQISSMPSAAVFAEQSQNDSAQYLQLLLLPPRESGATRKLPREVVYVVDTSGSMGGNSIRQAKESLLLALSRLDAQDRFNIIEFNSHHRSFYPRPVIANQENIHRARDWVESLSATGGTEMAPALKEALSQQLDEQAGELVRQVVFITDGAVGNERALFEIIQQRLGQVRLFTVGIGSAPNSHFMTKAAQIGRGSAVHIGDLGEVQTQMGRLFEKLENPLVTDLRVDFPQGIKLEGYPKQLPDLYLGEPVRLVARIEGQPLGLPSSGELVVSGRLAGKRFSRSISLAQLAVDQRGDEIGSVWARAKIAGLRNMQRQRGPLARTTGEGEEVADPLKQQILTLALRHQLASPYTSFVAVEETPVRPLAEALKSNSVPNAVASGQNLQRFTYPSTATGVYGQFLAALLLLLGGWGLRARATITRSVRVLLCGFMPDVRRCQTCLEHLLARRLSPATIKSGELPPHVIGARIPGAQK
ncbi:marine proteobacterial sortase target protein [Microbulbifer agarilyticus]|uniref:Marine proteobacterial sortase target protein n=1 Tax=Microbulbifer agarilyticus TaxID=260552 RepID=A0A1Q2M7R4_9GAMM|nr:marine proteobacterial sortase target protein [Microbulbifer agarilyticus]AQQ68588.1 marine proteobacterial sortase target protein [Microbulbifer agarilyticus]